MYKYIFKTGLLCFFKTLLVSCVAPDSPEYHERPYVLTDVKISPQQPAITDTVTLEVIGEGDSTLIDEFFWTVGEDPSFKTRSNWIEWINNNRKDTVKGHVWGSFKSTVEYSGSTNTVYFKIIFTTQ